MRRILVLVLFAALAAALTSCSRLPTAPGADTQLGRGSANQAIGQVDDTPPPIEGQGGLVNSISLEEGVGGTLTTGRFTLVIDKNSLTMPTRITMIQPDPDVMQVEFEITPPEANYFKTPVQLVADCSNDPLDQVMDETMYWWDGAWQEAPATSMYHADRTITAHAHQLSNGRIAPRGEGSAIRARN